MDISKDEFFFMVQTIKSLSEENLNLKKTIDELRQTIEDVAIGTRMECVVCGQYHPCMCDKK